MNAGLGIPMPTRASASRAARSVPENMKGALHVPFEEFSAKSIEQLVGMLEKEKPEGTTVEVTPMEDSHHSPCLQQMQAIFVQTIGPEGQPVQTHFMYQYCPACKIGVRVL